MRLEHPLANLDRALRVPPRRRLDLLLELGADMDGLQRELERRGVEPAQARGEVLRWVVPTADTISLLEAQHAPALGRWARAAGMAGNAERVGMGLVAVAVLAFGLLALGEAGSLGTLGISLWLQVGLIALLAANWVQAATGLWLVGDLRGARRHALWRRQLGLVVGVLAIGALGTAWEGHRALSAFGQFAPTPQVAWGAVRTALIPVILGVTAATFGLFSWLALMPRLISDEEVELRISTFFRRSGIPFVSGS